MDIQISHYAFNRRLLMLILIVRGSATGYTGSATGYTGSPNGHPDKSVRIQSTTVDPHRSRFCNWIYRFCNWIYRFSEWTSR
ncbi:unnamed protein product [Adineta ricciae]|nr:unnamed protein product [Adineta ricciae]